MNDKTSRAADYLGHIFRVDLEIVWKTIHNDLPALKLQIEATIRQLT